MEVLIWIMWRKEKSLALAGIWLLCYPADNMVSIQYYAIPVPTKGNRELPAYQGYNILLLLFCGNLVNRCHCVDNTRCLHLGQKESKCRMNYYAVSILFPSCCCVLCFVSFASIRNYFIFITQKIILSVLLTSSFH